MSGACHGISHVPPVTQPGFSVTTGPTCPPPRCRQLPPTKFETNTILAAATPQHFFFAPPPQIPSSQKNVAGYVPSQITNAAALEPL